MKTAISILICMAFVLSCSSGSSFKEPAKQTAELSEAAAESGINIDPVPILALAEKQFAVRKYKAALENVQKIIINFSETVHTDHAFFLSGKIYSSALNFHMDIEKARASYRMVISSPPETEYDKLAERELERIK